MGKEFSITPRRGAARGNQVPPHRHADCRTPTRLPTLEKLRQFEPISMRGQPPIVWDRAEDIYVYDKYGNRWLDWSTGVLVTNAGHGAPEVREAIIDAGAAAACCTTTVFPSEERADARRVSRRLAPRGPEEGLPAHHRLGGDRVRHQARALPRHQGRRTRGRSASSASSAASTAARSARSRPAAWPARRSGSSTKTPRSSRRRSRTVTGRRTRASSASSRRSTSAGSKPENIAGVMMETYQGVGPDFAPVEYVRQLARVVPTSTRSC